MHDADLILAYKGKQLSKGVVQALELLDFGKGKLPRSLYTATAPVWALSIRQKYLGSILPSLWAIDLPSQSINLLLQLYTWQEQPLERGLQLRVQFDNKIDNNCIPFFVEIVIMNSRYPISIRSAPSLDQGTLNSNNVPCELRCCALLFQH